MRKTFIPWIVRVTLANIIRNAICHRVMLPSWQPRALLQFIVDLSSDSVCKSEHWCKMKRKTEKYVDEKILSNTFISFDLDLQNASDC